MSRAKHHFGQVIEICTDETGFEDKFKVACEMYGLQIQDALKKCNLGKTIKN